MKYVYGPVQSRRLGFSLGVSVVPYKVCSFDCVYCQLKRTTEKTTQRKSYVAPKEILSELKTFFENAGPDLKIDYVTFSGSGEPTLHQAIGRLIRSAKALTGVPVALITNGSALVDAAVRKDILDADLIVPSLDAVTQDVFEKIDRPAATIKISDIIECLREFRKEFKGKLWLEVMLVRGLNDATPYLKKIKKVVDTIKPDRVQLNSPVRPPAHRWVRPPTPQTLKKAKVIFGAKCDIV